MIFNQKQAEFIKKEFDIDVEADKEIILDKKVFDHIIDESFLIEGVESDIAENCPLSERGEIAVSIVDMVCKGRSGKNKNEN